MKKMPKATKLHAKGKTNTIEKPCKQDKETSDNLDPEESMRQFQLELCWCIQQLERFLSEKKGSEKQMQDTWKVLTVLKNNNQPMIRKRQLMRTHFGNYRAKMEAEEKKLAKLASKIKISETPDKPKATFVRKSAFLTTGDDSFRFNFNLAPEHVDNVKDGNTAPHSNDKGDSPVENVEASSTNLEGTKSSEGNISRNVAGNSESLDAGNTKQTSDESSAKKFKFSFTNSQFKFNFNV